MILDEQQLAAVTSTDRNIIVSAGAGSGKTRVLTERVQWLINSMEIEPHNIVAITFTNLAADEMMKRLAHIPMIGDAFIGTIHSFANKIYKTKEEQYTILDDDVNQALMKEVLFSPKHSALTFERWLKYMDCVQLVELGKLEPVVLQDFLLPSERNTLRNCATDYDALKKKRNIITFDELLGHATKHYETLGASIEHVLVDELQDIGPLEYKFITGLKAENYFVVGDDHQAIYSWKGGNVEIFNSLLKNKDWKTYILENNYRNSKKIIDLGNKILNGVQGKSIRKVNGLNKNKGTIIINSRMNSPEIVKLVGKDTTKYGDWFILTRTNAEKIRLAELLEKHKIPFISVQKSEMTLEQLEEVLKGNMVKLLTVHSAKGLESKKVIMYGNFPINVPAFRINREERLVTYVGVTRAIDELHLFN